ncbi:MAG TPA: radical SAM protein [Candidatus Paceibacterota bacterium]
MNMYFRLKPECYLILGTTKSIIYNLLAKESIWLDEKNTDILIKSENNNIVSNDEDTLKKLEAEGWGCFYSKKVYIEKLRITNMFNRDRMWKASPYINTATLQLTNNCNLSCSFCKDTFCATCTVIDKNDKELNKEQWFKVLDDLLYFGTKAVIFTGGEASLKEDFNEIINYSISKGFIVSVHTNGLKLIENLPKKVFLVVSLFNENDLQRIRKYYASRENVTLITFNKLNKAIKNWKIVCVTKDSSCVNIKSMKNTNLERFFSKKLGDECLGGKITITSNGDVIPCLGKKNQKLSNIIEDGISQTIKKLHDEVWTISIDDVKDRKCTKCEFRYLCTACGKVEPEKQCSYDLRCGQWN